MGSVDGLVMSSVFFWMQVRLGAHYIIIQSRRFASQQYQQAELGTSIASITKEVGSAHFGRYGQLLRCDHIGFAQDKRKEIM